MEIDKLTGSAEIEREDTFTFDEPEIKTLDDDDSEDNQDNAVDSQSDNILDTNEEKPQPSNTRQKETTKTPNPKPKVSQTPHPSFPYQPNGMLYPVILDPFTGGELKFLRRRLGYTKEYMVTLLSKNIKGKNMKTGAALTYYESHTNKKLPFVFNEAIRAVVGDAALFVYLRNEYKRKKGEDLYEVDLSG